MSETKVSRRAFIGGAIVSPAIVMAAAQPAASVVIESTPQFAPIDPDWRWWAGDGEYYRESFDTFEAAMEYARSEGCKEVIRAHQTVMRCPIEFTDSDVFDAMEKADDGTNEPGISEDGDAFSRVGDDDIQDLVDRLNAAAKAWFHERGIGSKLQVYYFQEVTDRTSVEAGNAANTPKAMGEAT